MKKTKLNYISEQRKKEVEQIFETLNLLEENNLANSYYRNDGSFEQFSLLKSTGIKFETVSSSS